MTKHEVIRWPVTGNLTITGTCPVTHKQWRVDGVKEADYEAWLAGAKIQNVMPYLNADEREQLITGICSEGWEQTFSHKDAEES